MKDRRSCEIIFDVKLMLNNSLYSCYGVLQKLIFCKNLFLTVFIKTGFRL